MSDILTKQLHHTKERFNEIKKKLDSSSLLRENLKVHFSDLNQIDHEIPHWLELIQARNFIEQKLDSLPDRVDHNDRVIENGVSIQVKYIRLIDTQSYLSLTWALTDSIIAAVGKILCTSDARLNKAQPPQLISHFIQNHQNKKTSALFSKPIKEEFGWPIGISYAILNHFIHEGGAKDNISFFEEYTLLHPFRVSEKGWNNIKKIAENRYSAHFSNKREGWPESPQEDLRKTLSFCHKQIDQALAILVNLVAEILSIHMKYALEMGEKSQDFEYFL